MANHRYPYKIKPDGGGLISAHYKNLVHAISAARNIVDARAAASVDVVARGSDIVLARVDRQGVHDLESEANLDETYGFLTPEYLAAARLPTEKTGADAGYYLRGNGPSLRETYRKLFAAVRKRR